MVIRIEKNKDYTTMSNCHLRDKDLSLKAKGLMSLMLSLPENWNYSVDGLVSICKENATCIESTLKELKSCGYLKVFKKLPNETESGRIEYEYVLYEQKQEVEKQGVDFLGVEFLGVEKQEVEIQGVENQDQINTNKLNTNKESTKKESTDDRERKESKEKKVIASKISDEKVRVAIIDFLKMRDLIGKPMNESSLILLIDKLNQLSNNNPDIAVKILNQSTINNWSDIYQLDKKESATKTEQKFDYGGKIMGVVV